VQKTGTALDCPHKETITLKGLTGQVTVTAQY
jgi:hypothetical protein